MPNNTPNREYKLPKLRDADKSTKIGTTTADNPGNCATQMGTKTARNPDIIAQNSLQILNPWETGEKLPENITKREPKLSKVWDFWCKPLG